MCSLIALAPTPPNIAWFATLQKNIQHSQSYTFIKKLTGNRIPSTNIDLSQISKIMKDPQKLKKLQSMPEFNEIISDKRFQTLFSDKDVLQSIKDNNFGELFSNPEMKKLFQDPEILKKFFTLQKKIMAGNVDEETANNETKSKWIDIN